MPSIGIQADAPKEVIRRAFESGRRAGIWLAFNGPIAQAKARRADVQAMRRQDVALEGLGDVFGRAEVRARNQAIVNRATARVKARREDIQARERQDEAIQGLGDVFGMAEREAQPQQEISIPTELELLRYRARDAPAIKERLRGITGAQLYNFYRKEGGATREMIRELATLLSIKHRRAGESSIMSAQDLASTIARYVNANA